MLLDCFVSGYPCYIKYFILAVGVHVGKEFLNRRVSAFVFCGGYPCYQTVLLVGIHVIYSTLFWWRVN